MSVRALTWAFDANGITPVAKLLLIYLSDGAYGRQPFSINIERACRFVGVDEVYTSLSELVGSGLLVGDGDGYRLNLPIREAVQQPRVETGFVYFIQSNGLIKIGTSRTPTLRIKALRREWPHPIEVLRVIRGGHSVESHYHAKFSHLRQFGEWFRSDPELIAFIANLNWAAEWA